MSGLIHAFEYLKSPQPARGVCVAFGDEALLKRLVLGEVCRLAAGDGDDQAPFTSLDGDEAEWRDVADQLSSMSLFGSGGQLVVVRDADKFVTKHRPQLEKYFEKPKTKSLLVMDVAKWPSNTRLYKQAAATGTMITCKLPELPRGRGVDSPAIAKWLVARGKQAHRVKMSVSDAELMLDLAGTELGLLDQELAKLALQAEAGQVTSELIRDVVGGWRARSVWEMVDLAADGRANEALASLDQLLQMGEHPVALFGQIAWSLRRFAAATRIFQQAEAAGKRLSLSDALTQAGVRKFPRDALSRAERQLRQLRRERAGQLYQKLLEVDLALKGTHSHKDRARLILERLFVFMSKQASPPAKSRAG